MTCLRIGSFILIILWCNNVDSVMVKVEQGWLRGECKTTTTKLATYYSFKGIPYAAPPVGKLRFLAPRPALKWNGIRNALEHGTICSQPISYTNFTPTGSEDCLFLNVYTPNLSPARPLSVIVFIHGGTYLIGSGNTDKFDPDFLMPYNVILVTLNYRLGAFGFLAVDTEEVPGNAGMKDTIAAMQWVQRNIEKFGGNPKSVTLIGQASGASMVSLHVVSPAAKGLFDKAVVMSSSCLNDWSITPIDPRRRAFALGRDLGRDTNDPQEVIRYLQSVPAKDIIQSRPNVLLADNILNIQYTLTYFAPNVEKKFGNGTGQYLTTRPTVLMCKGEINHVDIMIGHTESEGSKVTAESDVVFFRDYPRYKELSVPLKISLYRSPREVLELADRIQRFYYIDQLISRKVALDAIRFNSYFVFVVDIHAYIEWLPKPPGTRRFFYEFAMYTSRNVYAKLPEEKYGIRKATHRDDIPYLFNGTFYKQVVDVNSKVFDYIQFMCKLYTNFVIYGTPTPDKSLGLIWPEFDRNDRNYVKIGNNKTLTPKKISLKSGDLKFWGDIYKSTGIDIYSQNNKKCSCKIRG